MDPGKTRHSLLAQHARLQAQLAESTGLAAAFARGEEVSLDLEAALARLRDAFAEHNRHEEAVLEPMLARDSTLGPLRIARMMEEHREEHRVIREFLARPAAALVAELADWAEEISAHMEAEERTFLSPQVLRE